MRVNNGSLLARQGPQTPPERFHRFLLAFRVLSKPLKSYSRVPWSREYSRLYGADPRRQSNFSDAEQPSLFGLEARSF